MVHISHGNVNNLNFLMVLGIGGFAACALLSSGTLVPVCGMVGVVLGAYLALIDWINGWDPNGVILSFSYAWPAVPAWADGQ